MQEKERANRASVAGLSAVPAGGRILAIDPGTKRCGVAICDELRVTTRPLDPIRRTSWKELLSDIKQLISEYDAKALVIGLPLESDGSDGDMTVEARTMAKKLALSCNIPVVLQDERVTSYEAKAHLWAKGSSLKETKQKVDSEAAAIILADLLDRLRSASGD